MTHNFDDSIHGIDIVKELGWQNVTERRMYLTCVLMYKCVHGIAPSYLSDDIVYSSDVPGHETRNASQNVLYLPFSRTE